MIENYKLQQFCHTILLTDWLTVSYMTIQSCWTSSSLLWASMLGQFSFESWKSAGCASWTFDIGIGTNSSELAHAVGFVSEIRRLTSTSVAAKNEKSSTPNASYVEWWSSMWTTRLSGRQDCCRHATHVDSFHYNVRYVSVLYLLNNFFMNSFVFYYYFSIIRTDNLTFFCKIISQKDRPVVSWRSA